MRSTKPSGRVRESDGGFTLGEALIAVTLTLIVVTAAIETLTRSLALTGTSRVISETNHGLQAAMSLMVRDIMQTGQGIPLGGIPIPGGAEPVLRPGPDDDLTFAADTVTIPALSPGDELGPTIAGEPSDIITVLYIDRTINLGETLVSIAADGSSMEVGAAWPVTGVDGIRAGDLILFSNPLGNALQMVTTTPTSQAVAFDEDDPMQLNQRGASEGTILNLQESPGVFPPTSATRVLMVSYYIDNVTDPTLPRLVRRVNMGNRLAIAMGIENLQITYDLVDGVTNPTNVATPPEGNGPNQIRKANLTLSARSQDPDPHTNQFFRNQMSTEVGLRSLSFVDRYR